MTPQKRKKANVQKILDNPVQSDAQQAIAPKKEGFWGWMSYVGWTLCLWFMFDMLCETIFIDHNHFLILLEYYFFYFLKGSEYLYYAALFCSWTVPCILLYKSPYPLLRSLSKILFFSPLYVVYFYLWGRGFKALEGPLIVFAFIWTMSLLGVLFYLFIKKIAIILTAVFFIGMIAPYGIFLGKIGLDIEFPEPLLYIFLFIPYLYYFYKKSKDGYRYVWLKALLFPLLFFIPIFFIPIETVEEPVGLMGDILY